jgi:hypothetical protein
VGDVILFRSRVRGGDVVAGEKTASDRVRELIEQAGLGQREAARELDINERAMRGYCAGEKVPRYVVLALERPVEMSRGIRESPIAGSDTILHDKDVIDTSKEGNQ